MQQPLSRSWTHILCFLFLGLFVQGAFLAPAYGQGGEMPNPLKGSLDTPTPDYEAPEREDFLDKEIKDAPKAAKEVADTMHKTLQKLNWATKKIGEPIATHVSKIPDGQGDLARESLTVGGKTFQNMPREYPLNVGQAGHLNESESWREYKKDSKAILMTDQFQRCLEPRKVEEPAYTIPCLINCPVKYYPHKGCHCGGLIPCFTQRRVVIEYYWPEYEISINRAGSKAISPIIFGDQSEEKWVRSALMRKNKEEIEEEQKKDLEEKGVRMSEWDDPEWRKDEFEYQEFGDNEFLFGRGMRPNFEWRAANDRPEYDWVGVKHFFGAPNRRCANWALPKPTSQRKILSNTQEDSILHRLNSDPVYMETMQLLEKEDYGKAIAASNNQDILGTEKDDSWKTGRFFLPHKTAYDREDFKVFRELQETVDITPKLGDRRMKDIVLRRLGETIMPYSASNEFMPVLSFHALRATATAIQLGSRKDSLSAFNSEEKRHSEFSLHKGRENRAGYEGPASRPEKITYVDKLQRIFPRVGEHPKANEPSAPGECFRPQNIPNYETDSDDYNWPKDLMQYHHLGESRWAVWNKRVMCVCEYCGKDKGCLRLHDGDVTEDKFHGILPMEETPERDLNALKIAYPKFLEYADKEGGPFTADAENSGRNISGMDTGTPGPYNLPWPRGPVAPPLHPDVPLFCIDGVPAKPT